jgi:single-strand DNA-binding protein
MNTLKNRVQLIGNLGMDPEVKNLANNKKMAQMRIATSESYRGADGKRVENTQWHTVVAWGNLADIAERFLRKGRKVAIEGKLVHRNYEDKTGNKKYITEIVANDVVMLDGKKDE